MFNRTGLTSVALGAMTAMLIGLANQTPAAADTRVTFGNLVPATPIAGVNSAPNAGTCPILDSKAQITGPYPTEWLKMVSAGFSHADTQVLIELDSVGNLLQARVNRSSGNSFLDQQALAAARGSKYSPDVHNCNSFKQSYYLDITFESPTVVLPYGAAGGGGRRNVQ